MQYKYPALCALFIAFLFCYCTEEGSIPAYIQIDKIEVDGENNVGIYDAWIYVDDNLLGVFELPANVPVISDGNIKISIGAGIKVNGLSGTRTRYPFYNFYTITRDLSETKTETITPSVSYASWTRFLSRENFEEDELNIEYADPDTASIDTSLIITNIDKISGSKSAIFYLDSNHYYIFFKLKGNFERPELENTVGTFLEINYKGSQFMQIGLFINETGVVDDIEVINIKPSEEWKKLYVDLGSYINQYPAGTTYQVYFASWTDTAAKETTFGIIDDLRLVQRN